MIKIAISHYKTINMDFILSVYPVLNIIKPWTPGPANVMDHVQWLFSTKFTL